MLAQSDLEFIGVAVGVVVSSIILFAFLRVVIFSYNSTRTMASQGQISTGEYILTDRSSINWGVLEPADNRTEPLVVSNQAPVPMQLHLTTSDWTPANASNFISLTWNYSGEALPAKASLPINLTIHIDPLIHDIYNFTFTINIQGDQLI